MKIRRLAPRADRKKKDGVSAKERGRLRPIVTITLTPEGIEMADELALMRGLSRSALLDQLVREEARRERTGIYAPEKTRK